MTEITTVPIPSEAADAPRTDLDLLTRLALLPEPDRSARYAEWVCAAVAQGRLLQAMELAAAVLRDADKWVNPQTGEREVPLALLHITDGGLPATMAVVRRGGHIVFCVEPLDGRTYSWYELTRAQCDELHDVLGYDKAPFR